LLPENEITKKDLACAKKKLTKIVIRELYDRVSILSDGKSFGELALLSKHAKRNSTIRCLTDCHFAVLSESDYEKVFARIEKLEQNEFVLYCRQMPFFKQSSNIFLTALRKYFTNIEVKRGQILCKQGQKCKHIWFIRKGEFEVFIQINLQDKF